MALGPRYKTPSVLESAMGGTIDPAAYQMENDHGLTLFDKLAEDIGASCGHGETDATHKWRPLLSDAIAAPTDPNKVTDYGPVNQTPLLMFLNVFGFHYVYSYDPSGWWNFRRLNLTYGPESEDWQIWVTNPVDEIVGVFWEMVQREQKAMPGTWVD
ncbi:hypothetical protein BJX76DRAFT_360085 [Aspergillus varians]